MDFTEKFWKKIYQDNINKMIGTCYRYIPDRQIAEDLAHDAFIKAIDKSGTFRKKGAFEAWLRRIVINEVLQYLRKQKTNKYYKSQMQPWDDVSEPNKENNETSIIAQADFSQDELLEAINSIPEHHKLVFNLFAIDRYSHLEISKELGISLGTSKSHLSRARKKIQQVLYQKALEKQNKKERKKAFLLFLIPFKSKYIDRLYQRQFNSFELMSGNSFSFENVEWNTVSAPVIKGGLTVMNSLVITGISLGILSSVYFFKNNRSGKENTLIEKESHYEDTTYNKVNGTDTIGINPKIDIDSSAGKNSSETKTPVIIKKTLIRRKQVIIRDTIKIR